MSKSLHKMNNLSLPEDCAQQWEILLLLISSEEKKIDRTTEKEIDTINYFYRNEGVRKILQQWLIQMHQTYAKKNSESDTALKCDEVSLLWRQRGNDKFRGEYYTESYYCYSKSVLYAHQKGPMFPLALANRSAAFLKMKKFQECLIDVELALDNGYPTEQRHKLLLRRAECNIELQQREKARESLDLASAHIASLGLSAQVEEFDRHIKKLEEKLQNCLEPQPQPEETLPPCINGDNPNFVAASSALQLRRSDTAGRYVLAQDSLRRGDVIFSEEPYAWVALPSAHPVCEACCCATYNPLPCVSCSRSLYCSPPCRARAQAVHQWECVGAQAGLFATIGIAHLALRVLLITASEGFPVVPDGQPAPSSACDLFSSYSQVDNILIYKADMPPFYRMFNLVTNFDKMNNADYIQYALTATMLTLYLEQFTDFFQFLPSRVPYSLTPGQLRTFAAALMLRSLGQLVCNGHAALSLLGDSDVTGNTESELEVRRATAIYPSAAMMNHSCDPNIINTFHNSRLIIRCARELQPGAEVLNCYGPHRAREPTVHRRAQLRAQYYFHCTCTACKDSCKRDLVLAFAAYACQSCKGPVWGGARSERPHCAHCRAEFQHAPALAALEHADDLLAQAERAITLEQRCEQTHAAFRVKQQVWHRHHTGLRSLADRLARLYADLGEFSKSVELIKQNVQTLEYRFGSFSAEVAHELRKLSEVMLERIVRSPQNPDYRDWCLEAHKIIKKAVQLMELNFGSWEPMAKRLRSQEETIAAFLADSRAPGDDCVHHNLHYNLKI